MRRASGPAAPGHQVAFDLVVIGTLLAVAAPGIAKGIAHRATEAKGDPNPSER